MSADPYVGSVFEDLVVGHSLILPLQRASSHKTYKDSPFRFPGIRTQRQTGVKETIADLFCISPIGETSEAVLELQRNGLEKCRTPGFYRHEKEHPEVVPHQSIHCIVVDEVPQVEQHAVMRAVHDMGRMPGHERCSRTPQNVGSAPHVAHG